MANYDVMTTQVTRMPEILRSMKNWYLAETRRLEVRLEGHHRGFFNKPDQIAETVRRLENVKGLQGAYYKHRARFEG